MNIAYISLFFLSFSVYSKRIPHPNKYAKLKCSQRPGYLIDLNPPKFHTKYKSKIINGKRVVEKRPNIDYRPKTLSHTKVQSQIGGTCYASSASLMLEAYLGHPVSANQLALISKASKITPRSYIHPSENKFVLDGGTACNTIKAVAKSKVPICHRKLVPIENLQFNSFEAESFYKELTKFYDNDNLSNGDKEALKLAIQKAKSSTYPSCNDEKTLTDNATLAVKRYLWDIDANQDIYCSNNFLEEFDECKKSFPKIFEPLNRETTDEDFDTMNVFKFSDSMNKQVDFFLSTIKETGLNSQNNKDVDKLMHDHFIRELASKFKPDNKYTKGIPNPDEFMQKNVGTLEENSDSFDQIVRGLVYYSDKETCKQYEKLKIYDDTFKGQICDQESSLLGIFQKIKSLSHHFFGAPEFIDTLLESLDSNRTPYDFLDQLIGDKCKRQGKPLPKQISCVGSSFPFRLKTELFQREKTHIRNEKFRSTRKLRDFIFTQLNKTAPTGLVGNPVEVGICTKFMNVRNYDFNWGGNYSPGGKDDNFSECEKSDKHGLHSLTVTGMRCRDGRVQYKLQNYWGKDATYKNPDLEVVPGQGSIWVSEKDLVNNTLSFEALKM